METALATLPPASTGHPKRAKAYAQCVEMQEALRKDVLCPDLKAQVRAACARAWDVLEERKRILRGRPLPGHLRPDLPASQRRPVKRIALLASSVDEPKESLSDPEGGGTLAP